MTHRNYGLSGRQRLGGASTSPSASLGNYAPSGSILVPTSPPLKRGKLSQALIDIAFLLTGALIVSATGIGIAGGLFILLFVRT